eukprot:m.100457 g.100457  ORF g.100457 m.100457 type:complete len:1870 (-) comp13709_c0_seq2:1448-7057(-)
MSGEEFLGFEEEENNTHALVHNPVFLSSSARNQENENKNGPRLWNSGVREVSPFKVTDFFIEGHLLCLCQSEYPSSRMAVYDTNTDLQTPLLDVPNIHDDRFVDYVEDDDKIPYPWFSRNSRYIVTVCNQTSRWNIKVHSTMLGAPNNGLVLEVTRHDFPGAPACFFDRVIALVADDEKSLFVRLYNSSPEYIAIRVYDLQNPKMRDPRNFLVDLRNNRDFPSHFEMSNFPANPFGLQIGWDQFNDAQRRDTDVFDNRGIYKPKRCLAFVECGSGGFRLWAPLQKWKELTRGVCFPFGKSSELANPIYLNLPTARYFSVHQMDNTSTHTKRELACFDIKNCKNPQPIDAKNPLLKIPFAQGNDTVVDHSRTFFLNPQGETIYAVLLPSTDNDEQFFEVYNLADVARRKASNLPPIELAHFDGEDDFPTRYSDNMFGFTNPKARGVERFYKIGRESHFPQVFLLFDEDDNVQSYNVSRNFERVNFIGANSLTCRVTTGMDQSIGEKKCLGIFYENDAKEGFKVFDLESGAIVYIFQNKVGLKRSSDRNVDARNEVNDYDDDDGDDQEEDGDEYSDDYSENEFEDDNDDGVIKGAKSKPLFSSRMKYVISFDKTDALIHKIEDIKKRELPRTQPSYRIKDACGGDEWNCGTSPDDLFLVFSTVTGVRVYRLDQGQPILTMYHSVHEALEFDFITLNPTRKELITENRELLPRPYTHLSFIDPLPRHERLVQLKATATSKEPLKSIFERQPLRYLNSHVHLEKYHLSWAAGRQSLVVTDMSKNNGSSVELQIGSSSGLESVKRLEDGKSVLVKSASAIQIVTPHLHGGSDRKRLSGAHRIYLSPSQQFIITHHLKGEFQNKVEFFAVDSNDSVELKPENDESHQIRLRVDQYIVLPKYSYRKKRGSKPMTHVILLEKNEKKLNTVLVALDFHGKSFKKILASNSDCDDIDDPEEIVPHYYGDLVLLEPLGMVLDLRSFASKSMKNMGISLTRSIQDYVRNQGGDPDKIDLDFGWDDEKMEIAYKPTGGFKQEKRWRHPTTIAFASKNEMSVSFFDLASTPVRPLLHLETPKETLSKTIGMTQILTPEITTCLSSSGKYALVTSKYLPAEYKEDPNFVEVYDLRKGKCVMREISQRKEDDDLMVTDAKFLDDSDRFVMWESNDRKMLKIFDIENGSEMSNLVVVDEKTDGSMIYEWVACSDFGIEQCVANEWAAYEARRRTFDANEEAYTAGLVIPKTCTSFLAMSLNSEEEEENSRFEIMAFNDKMKYGAGEHKLLTIQPIEFKDGTRTTRDFHFKYPHLLLFGHKNAVKIYTIEQNGNYTNEIPKYHVRDRIVEAELYGIQKDLRYFFGKGNRYLQLMSQATQEVHMFDLLNETVETDKPQCTLRFDKEQISSFHPLVNLSLDERYAVVYVKQATYFYVICLFNGEYQTERIDIGKQITSIFFEGIHDDMELFSVISSDQLHIFGFLDDSPKSDVHKQGSHSLNSFLVSLGKIKPEQRRQQKVFNWKHVILYSGKLVAIYDESKGGAFVHLYRALQYDSSQTGKRDSQRKWLLIDVIADQSVDNEWAGLKVLFPFVVPVSNHKEDVEHRENSTVSAPMHRLRCYPLKSLHYMERYVIIKSPQKGVQLVDISRLARIGSPNITRQSFENLHAYDKANRNHNKTVLAVFERYPWYVGTPLSVLRPFTILEELSLYSDYGEVYKLLNSLLSLFQGEFRLESKQYHRHRNAKGGGVKSTVLGNFFRGSNRGSNQDWLSAQVFLTFLGEASAGKRPGVTLLPFPTDNVHFASELADLAAVTPGAVAQFLSLYNLGDASGEVLEGVDVYRVRFSNNKSKIAVSKEKNEKGIWKKIYPDAGNSNQACEEGILYNSHRS